MESNFKEKLLAFGKWLLVETLWYLFGLFGLICVFIFSIVGGSYLYFVGLPW